MFGEGVVIERLIKMKESKGLTFQEIGEMLGRDKVWAAALFYRQASASREEAEILKNLLGLDEDLFRAVMKPPMKGALFQEIPSDPLIYRLYEIVRVYGLPIKAVVHEAFGDGIMSAIDLTVRVDREENPEGDRVVIILDGKFLPYRKW